MCDLTEIRGEMFVFLLFALACALPRALMCCLHLVCGAGVVQGEHHSLISSGFTG